MNVLPIVLRTKGCTKLAEAMQIYIDDLPSPMTIDAEIHAWEVLWKTKEECGLPESAAQTLKQTDKMLFPNIHTLLRIFCTLPITSCECERTVSGLRRLKTYMRTTTGEERMNGLLLTHIHYGVEFDEDQIITEFARKQPSRMELVDILQ